MEDDHLRPPTATFPYPRRPQRKKCNVENVGKVPAFVSALWSMLNDDRWSHIVHWSDDGTSFIIVDEKALSEHVLPQYFNTISVASFGRQLNFYNFKRVMEDEIPEDEVASNLLAQMNGEKPKRKEMIEYKHRFFRRDEPELLTRVIRKTNHRVIKQMMDARQAVRAVQAVAATVGGGIGGSGSGGEYSDSGGSPTAAEGRGEARMPARGGGRGSRGATSSLEAPGEAVYTQTSSGRRTKLTTSRALQSAGIQLVAATSTTIPMTGTYTYSNSSSPGDASRGYVATRMPPARHSARRQTSDASLATPGTDSPRSGYPPSDGEYVAHGSGRGRSRAQARAGDIPLNMLLDGEDDANILVTGGAGALAKILSSMLGVYVDPTTMTTAEGEDGAKRVNIGSAAPSPVPNLSIPTLRSALTSMGLKMDPAKLASLGFPAGIVEALCREGDGEHDDTEPEHGEEGGSGGGATHSGHKRPRRRPAKHSEGSGSATRGSGGGSGALVKRNTGSAYEGDAPSATSRGGWDGADGDSHLDERMDEMEYDPYSGSYQRKSRARTGNTPRARTGTTPRGRNSASAGAGKSEARPLLQLMRDFAGPGGSNSDSSLESASSPALQQAALQLVLARVQGSHDPLESDRLGSHSGSDSLGSARDSPASSLLAALSQVAASASASVCGGDGAAPTLGNFSAHELISAVTSLELPQNMTEALVTLIERADANQSSASGDAAAGSSLSASASGGGGSGGGEGGGVPQSTKSIYMMNSNGDLVEYDFLPVSLSDLHAQSLAEERGGSGGLHEAGMMSGLQSSEQLGLQSSSLQWESPAAHGSNVDATGGFSGGFSAGLAADAHTNTRAGGGGGNVGLGVGSGTVAPPDITLPPRSNDLPEFVSPTAASAPGATATQHPMGMRAARPDNAGDLTPVLRAIMRQKFGTDSSDPTAARHGGGEPRLAFASPSAYLRATQLSKSGYNHSGSGVGSSRLGQGDHSLNSTRGIDSTRGSEFLVPPSTRHAPMPEVFLLSPRHVIRAENLAGHSTWEATASTATATGTSHSSNLNSGRAVSAPLQALSTGVSVTTVTTSSIGSSSNRSAASSSGNGSGGESSLLGRRGAGTLNVAVPASLLTTTSVLPSATSMASMSVRGPLLPMSTSSVTSLGHKLPSHNLHTFLLPGHGDAPQATGFFSQSGPFVPPVSTTASTGTGTGPQALRRSKRPTSMRQSTSAEPPSGFLSPPSAILGHDLGSPIVLKPLATPSGMLVASGSSGSLSASGAGGMGMGGNEGSAGGAAMRPQLYSHTHHHHHDVGGIGGASEGMGFDIGAPTPTGTRGNGGNSGGPHAKRRRLDDVNDVNDAMDALHHAVSLADVQHTLAQHEDHDTGSGMEGVEAGGSGGSGSVGMLEWERTKSTPRGATNARRGGGDKGDRDRGSITTTTPPYPYPLPGPQTNPGTGASSGQRYTPTSGLTTLHDYSGGESNESANGSDIVMGAVPLPVGFARGT